MVNSEKIVLPDFIIADIYKNHLVELDSVTAQTSHPQQTQIKKPAAENATSLKFLGQNKKKVSVLVSDANAIFINDKELAFLSKILGACNLNIGDISILNTEQSPAVFEQLQNELNPLYLLLIGVKPASIQLPFTMPDFQVQHFSNCTIVCIPALSTMIDDTPANKILKGKLWISLKKAFDL